MTLFILVHHGTATVAFSATAGVYLTKSPKQWCFFNMTDCFQEKTHADRQANTAQAFR